MIHCWNSSSHASLSSIVIKIECQNSFVPLYGRQITQQSYQMWPRGILNRSEPRNNMVYVSYGFFCVINLLFIFIIPHHSHIVPFTILLRVLITKAWPWRVGPFSTLHDQHKRYHESQVMTWIGELLDLNLAEERPFLPACWYFDNVFLLGHSGNKLIPSSPTHFC